MFGNSKKYTPICWLLKTFISNRKIKNKASSFRLYVSSFVFHVSHFKFLIFMHHILYFQNSSLATHVSYFMFQRNKETRILCFIYTTIMWKLTSENLNLQELEILEFYLSLSQI